MLKDAEVRNVSIIVARSTASDGSPVLHKKKFWSAFVCENVYVHACLNSPSDHNYSIFAAFLKALTSLSIKYYENK